MHYIRIIAQSKSYKIARTKRERIKTGLFARAYENSLQYETISCCIDFMSLE